MNVITTRWLVARRPYRELKFGESIRDVMRWAVTPYIPVRADRAFGSPTFFPTLSGAIAYARREQARNYPPRTPR